MGLFDFFRKSQPETTTNLSVEAQIEIAIEVFEKNSHADWQGIVNQINKKLANEDLAFDLYRFIPIAYCRQFLHDMKFPEVYLTADNKGQFINEHNFRDNKLFVAIERFVKERSNNRVGQGKIMNILKHSSDFDAINQALNNGSQLEDLKILPPRFT